MNRWWESSPEEELRRQEHSHLENWSHVDSEQEAEKAISPSDSYVPRALFQFQLSTRFSCDPCHQRLPDYASVPCQPSMWFWDFSSSFQTILKDTVVFVLFCFSRLHFQKFHMPSLFISTFLLSIATASVSFERIFLSELYNSSCIYYIDYFFSDEAEETCLEQFW